MRTFGHYINIEKNISLEREGVNVWWFTTKYE